MRDVPQCCDAHMRPRSSGSWERRVRWRGYDAVCEDVQVDSGTTTGRVDGPTGSGGSNGASRMDSRINRGGKARWCREENSYPSARGEGVEKYNQLMRIEEELGEAAIFAARKGFVR